MFILTNASYMICDSKYGGFSDKSRNCSPIFEKITVFWVRICAGYAFIDTGTNRL